MQSQPSVSDSYAVVMQAEADRQQCLQQVFELKEKGLSKTEFAELCGKVDRVSP